ncbi:diamine acetyltransferase 2-like [Argonauta hians]
MELITVRHATADDCEHLVSMFEERVKHGEKRKAPSVSDLKSHCFNGENNFNILVCVWNDKDSLKAQHSQHGPLVGYMFYHYIYSTWEAKSLEITDGYVLPLPENEAISKELFHAVCKMSVEDNIARVQWQTKGAHSLKNLAEYFNAVDMIKSEGWQSMSLGIEGNQNAVPT